MIYAAIASAVISIAALITSIITYRQTVIHNRKKDTLTAYNILQNEVLDEINQTQDEHIRHMIETKNGDNPGYRDMCGLLARIENFSIGVLNEVYDEKLLYSLAGNYFIDVFTKVRPIIEHSRQISGKEDYIAFEKLTEKMKSMANT